ncbi:AMP-binding protein [Leifsonia virtsii]|uniref:AMP-binding protein n=1 Tax=Leifsonia virtsii TaxID=3035915 RepID=A0ABT8IZF5_9MICO|nr:AMP-binding protein [Leifsonia virtsii]MDN4598185.1 AMP-binding protein [Leifsonia virtsii]
MTRAVRVVDSSRPEEVFAAIADALGGGGPAVVPRAGKGVAADWPEAEDRVAQNVALVIETSGSTGVPKRVALSADALLASAAASAGALGGQGQWVLALPAHYVAGAQVLVRSLAAETEPIFYGAGHFDAEGYAEVAETMRHDLRYTSLVPVQLSRLVEAVEAGSRRVGSALRRFDGILVGGQALAPALRERALQLGARIVTTYGSSETAGGCVYDGVPIGTTVVRENGGQLEISGPSLAEGYIGDAERTAAAFVEHDGARWYRTGDVGRVDERGRVTVLGRSDNVIISGGEKVLLDAVERAVQELTGFEHAVVVAVDDAEWGQVPIVVLEGAAPESLAAVREHVAGRVGRAGAPARIVGLEKVPRLASGKPDRIALADTAAAAASGAA